MRFRNIPDEDTDILGCSLISKSGGPCGSNESVLHDFCDHLQGEGGVTLLLSDNACPGMSGVSSSPSANPAVRYHYA